MVQRQFQLFFGEVSIRHLENRRDSVQERIVADARCAQLALLGERSRGGLELVLVRSTKPCKGVQKKIVPDIGGFICAPPKDGAVRELHGSGRRCNERRIVQGSSATCVPFAQATFCNRFPTA